MDEKKKKIFDWQGDGIFDWKREIEPNGQSSIVSKKPGKLAKPLSLGDQKKK